MSTLGSLFVTFCNALPWVAIALMAIFALRKNPRSFALMAQALGAAALFLLAMLSWFLTGFLHWMGVSYDLTRAAGIVFGFLMFLSLVAFALGYCMERFSRRRESGARVSASPAG